MGSRETKREKFQIKCVKAFKLTKSPYLSLDKD